MTRKKDKRASTSGAPTRIAQLDLAVAIQRHLANRHPGLMANGRQLDAITEAADRIVREFARPHEAAQADSGLKAWLASDDTGISSLTMARHLAPLAGLNGVPGADRFGDGPPSDPSDFWRCLGLLKAVPALREHLPLMAEVGPVWARMVAHWAEMEALFAEESPTGKCPKLYALMQRLRDEPRVHP